MKFKSRKDWWLTLLVWGSMLFAICSSGYGLIVKPTTFFELILIVLLAIVLPLFMLWLWCTTEYIIKEKYLIIRSGPFKKRILLESIKSVRKTLNPISSPALSLRRIEINYGIYGFILISPKNREKFISTLLEIYPDIKVISK